MMRVLGISCSPRTGGNTETLIRAALEGAQSAGAEETEFLSLSRKKISACNGCLACLKTGKCSIEDDMQDIYPMLIHADGIIIGTPVYFWTVSAQAKILIDRTYCIIRGKDGNMLRGKTGAAIVVTRRVGGSGALGVLNNYMTFSARLACVGGAIAFGGDPGTAKKDDRGMSEAIAVGRAIARAVKLSALTLAKDTRQPMPSRDIHSES